MTRPRKVVAAGKAKAVANESATTAAVAGVTEEHTDAAPVSDPAAVPNAADAEPSAAQADASTPRKRKKAAAEENPAPAKRKKATVVAEADLPTFPDVLEGEPTCPAGSWSIVSYNVCSLRASLNKGLVDYLRQESPDILCVQETKMSATDAENAPWGSPGEAYPHKYFTAPVEKSGYSGTGILSKHKPLAVTYGALLRF